MNVNPLSQDRRKTIAERIKALRKEKELSQEDLASLLSVKQQTVAAWENGDRTIKLNTLYDLAAIFNVSADFILGISNFRSAEGEANGSIYGLNDRTEVKLKEFAKDGGRGIPGKYVKFNASATTQRLVRQLLDREDFNVTGSDDLRSELMAFLDSAPIDELYKETPVDVFNDLIEAILGTELLTQLLMCRYCVRELNKTNAAKLSIVEELQQRKLSVQYLNHHARCVEAFERATDVCAHKKEYKQKLKELTNKSSMTSQDKDKESKTINDPFV